MKVLQIKRFFLFILPVILVWGAGDFVNAQSTISCHCFRDREFKPADRFAADEYILATGFNSLLSRVFDISKKEIIMLKMSRGVPQNDLLIGFQIARTSGYDVNRLFDLRHTEKEWSAIISGLPEHDRIMTDPLLKPVASGDSPEDAGRNIADEIIGKFFKMPRENIEKLRKAGLTEKEITLLLILNYAGNRDQDELLKQRREQDKSWSEIAHNMGIEPSEAGRLILAFPTKRITE